MKLRPCILEPPGRRNGMFKRWASRELRGGKRENKMLKYSSIRLVPTCSNIPIEEIAFQSSRRAGPGSLGGGSQRSPQACVPDPFRASSTWEALSVTPRRGRVVLGSVHGHRAPPATDVEQACSRPFGKAELPADEVVLGALRLSSDMPSRSKRAQEYVIDGPSTRR